MWLPLHLQGQVYTSSENMILFHWSSPKPYCYWIFYILLELIDCFSASIHFFFLLLHNLPIVYSIWAVVHESRLKNWISEEKNESWFVAFANCVVWIFPAWLFLSYQYVSTGRRVEKRCIVDTAVYSITTTPKQWMWLNLRV